MKHTCNEEKIKAVKSLLKLYRKVLHSVNNNLVYLDEEIYVNSRKHLSDIVDGLIIFENKTAENNFDEKVWAYHENLELLKLLEKSVIMVKEYPDNGKTYYAILERLYFDNFSYCNEEVMQILELSRSTYFRYLKKAYICFYNHFISVIQCENKSFNENALLDDYDGIY